MAIFFYGTTILFQVSFSWFGLLHHCFIGIMIWLISSIAPLFYCNYDWADFFYSTPFLLLFRVGNFFYCATFLLQLWFGWFLLFHDYFISIIIWLFSSIPPPFNWNYDLADYFYGTTVSLQIPFSWFFLLHHCFIKIMIWLIFCTARLFYSN